MIAGRPRNTTAPPPAYHRARDENGDCPGADHLHRPLPAKYAKGKSPREHICRACAITLSSVPYSADSAGLARIRYENIMLTPLLPKLQRNQIFAAIQSAGLDPIEFDLEDDGGKVRIKHKWSESSLTVGWDAGRYVGHSIVGDAPPWPFETYSWQTTIPRISSWLEWVKFDLETPDLWAELRQEADLLGAISHDNENTPFTPSEQKEISKRLRELAEKVRHTHSLSEAQMQALNTKLDYLVKAAGRLGRIDWRNALVGAILGLVFTVALPPESARDIIFGLFRAIGQLGLPELPGG
jgi:hypothetical protein